MRKESAVMALFCIENRDKTVETAGTMIFDLNPEVFSLGVAEFIYFLPHPEVSMEVHFRIFIRHQKSGSSCCRHRYQKDREHENM